MNESIKWVEMTHLELTSLMEELWEDARDSHGMYNIEFDYPNLESWFEENSNTYKFENDTWYINERYREQ